MKNNFLLKKKNKKNLNNNQMKLVKTQKNLILVSKLYLNKKIYNNLHFKITNKIYKNITNRETEIHQIRNMIFDQIQKKINIWQILMMM